MKTKTTTIKEPVKLTPRDKEWLIKCVRRAVNAHGADAAALTADLHLVHTEACALDFEKLATCEDAVFLLDLAGMLTNLDRDLGLLRGFRPECARGGNVRRPRRGKEAAA